MINLVSSDGKTYLGQLVAIESLPDNCAYKQLLQDIAISPGIHVWIIATKGDEQVGDWVAYIGIPDIEFIKSEWITEYYPYYLQGLSSPSGVKKYGWKLDEYTAKHFFPKYSHLVYRP